MRSLSLTQPHAIIMVGMPGSGKSFFAKKFSDTFHAPFVSENDISPLATSGEAAASLVSLQLKELLKTNQSIILELPTATRASRSELARAIRTAGYTPMFVWVQTDQETARQRSLKSKRYDDAGFTHEAKRFSQPHASEKAIVISGKHTYASQAKIILKHLSEPRAAISRHVTPPARTEAKRLRIN